jgi:hypothetical protein
MYTLANPTDYPTPTEVFAGEYLVSQFFFFAWFAEFCNLR